MASGAPSEPAITGSTWTADAERYDRWFDQRWGRYASQIEHGAVLAAAGDLTGATVADIGCGTGRLTTQLEARAATVVGVDPDPAMLAVAADRVTAPLLVGDGHHLPLRDGAVDVAVAVTVCEFTADPALVVAELARVTRAGGRVIVGALSRHSPWGLVNRDQFARPPWDTATFFARADLYRLGAPHGHVSVTPALYAPSAWPLIAAWGPPLEVLGRTIARGWGAFNVMAITRRATP